MNLPYITMKLSPTKLLRHDVPGTQIEASMSLEEVSAGEMRVFTQDLSMFERQTGLLSVQAKARIAVIAQVNRCLSTDSTGPCAMIV